MPTDRDVALYGAGWERLAPEHARKDYVDQGQLRRLYTSARIVLNDHWDDMRERGYVSNRLFDALACEAFVVPDAAAGLQEPLDGTVVACSDLDALPAPVERYLGSSEEERRERGRRGRELVLPATRSTTARPSCRTG